MTAKLSRQILLGLAALVLLGIFVFHVCLARAPGRTQIDLDLAALQSSDKALDNAMASAQSAPLADYDSLAAAQQQMTLAAARLPGDLHQVYSGRQAARIDPALQTYLAAVAQKLTRVEDFKSRSALLKSCPTDSGIPVFLDHFSSEPDRAQIGPSRIALEDAYQAQYIQVRLLALISGLSLAVVSALLFGGVFSL